ncbi:DUF4097 family beta strand repeat-containing protein [Paenibacillus sp. R14(2021)]|uniref:DUF4097 family beta strand repeat-containing protein n=1 Tax=Paenibacillus sp. R14(2021) TaxID=2859228 RepID=UPI001C611D3D|nr:DUF4097 family beta strand repeat-containing protein [Paenibacillus sp. R14(2021)]
MRNWLLVGIILLVVGLIGAFGTLQLGGDFSFGTEEVHQQQQISAAGINTVAIDSGSIDLTIVPTDSSEVKATLTGRASKKYMNKLKLKLKLKKEGDSLIVAFEGHTGFSMGVSILNLDMKLELPQQQYRQLKLDSGSGDIQLSGMAIDAIALDGGSGDMKLSQLQTKELLVSLGSGNVDASDIASGGNVTVKANSGDVAVERLAAKQLAVDIGSGNVDAADVEAEVKVDTGSGDVSLAQKDITQPVNLKTGSGNVSLMTDSRPSQAEITYSTGSGSFDNDWPDAKALRDEDVNGHLTFGTGSVPVHIRTGSGDLDVGARS